jgi:diguanylate cyclase (GGDEF)-like protein
VRELAASEQSAWQLAHEDPLTGLPNRRAMIDLIDGALAARAPGEVVSLAVIDLDGLNEVNAVHGRHIGDALLADFGERLRQAAPQGAGRIGDDEFALVLTTSDTLDAQQAVANISHALARPFWLDEQAVQIGSTIGIAHVLRDGTDRDDLMRRADLTLRSAKRRNRGGLLEFNPALEAEFSARRFIERELRRALDNKTLDVHYQPIVTADGARIIGVEALLRWTHPERGPIEPGIFVPMAEQCGLMARLGEFALRRALADAKRWPALSIAVNVSPVQMRDPGFVNLVLSVLAETRITPSRVVLEMTEGVLIDNPEEAKRRLDALHAIGVQLALDDFGTGYSSLTYLRSYRFDMLKIDRGFVQGLGKSDEGEAIVRAIVALARALNLKIQAEGIETEEQRVLLRLAGCEDMQGFLFAKPGSRESIDRLLAQAVAPAAGSRRVKREIAAEPRPRAADRTRTGRHNVA